MSELELRLARIELLLRCLPFFEHQPETSTGALVRRQSQPGVGPSHKKPCPACGGEKQIRRRGIAYGCVGCGGSGDPVQGLSLSATELKRRLGRGWVRVDDYTAKKVGSADTELVSKARWVHCDAGCERGFFRNGQNCRHCSESGRPGYVLAPSELVRFRAPGVAVEIEVSAGGADPLIAALDEGYRGLGKSVQRRRLAGSFEELLAAMGELKQRLGPVHGLVVATYLEARLEPGALPERWRQGLRVGLLFIEARMPEEIRLPAGARAIERRRVAARRNGSAQIAA